MGNEEKSLHVAINDAEHELKEMRRNLLDEQIESAKVNLSALKKELASIEAGFESL
jgi:hypothetical protein